MKNNAHRAYRNHIELSSVARWVVIVMLFGILGGSFVYVRNQHVAKGELKRHYEDALVELRHEIEILDFQMASLTDRQRLERRLRQKRSKLVPIATAQVVTIGAPSEVERLASMPGEPAAPSAR